MRRARLLLASALLPAALAAPSACSESETDTTSSSTSSASTSSSSGGGTATTGPSSVSSGGGNLPEVFTVSGIVTDGVDPVEGAIVMQGGGSPDFVTGPDGAYTIEITTAIPGRPTVLASKEGYRTIGVELFAVSEDPIEIALRFVTPPDNANGYVFRAPGVGDPLVDTSTDFCGHCHTTLTAQFQTSAHARATKDPVVQDLYAGVSGAHADQLSCEQAGGIWRSGLVPGTAADAIAKCYLGAGVLPDLNPCGGAAAKACDDPTLAAAEKPSAFGRCADCHAAAIDGPAGGRSLHEATGLAFENGNHCDACHKVADVDLTKPPGVGGRLLLQRPRDKVSDEPGADLFNVMFGPLPDVPNEFMGGSYQPKFKSAEFCGGCHEQKQEALLPGASLDPARWPEGLPTHSTFSEWTAGPFNMPATQCQSCHMPPNANGLESTLDVTDETNASITFGFLRPPTDIRQHIFRGPLVGAPRLIDNALTVFATATPSAGDLVTSVAITNVGCGHAVPTGEPLRALVLLVRAEGCGGPFALAGGMTINDVGGAAAEGAVGAEITVAGAVMTWASGAARAKAGDVVRVVRPTGLYDDYEGVGFFADASLTAAEKGLEIRAPVGEATVLSVAAGAITLDAALPAQAGDVVYLGDAVVWPPVDGADARAFAGGAGYTFARVLVDPAGARNVPHWRAVDIASDNRIAPQVEATTSHTFAIPPGCTSADVTATVLYRPLPVGLARERGWEAKDYVIATQTQTVALP